MNLFFKYLKAKSKIIIFFFLSFFIFLSSFALYHLPLRAVVYPFVICLVFGLIFFLVEFIKEKKKHESLKHVIKLSNEMIEYLPKSNNFIDDDYKAIISQIRQDALTEAQIKEAAYKDLVDYYTVWAHQIKTPISSMKLTLQSMDNDEARKLSADLFRIEQYVEMVLTYLRLDSKSTDYVFKKESLDNIVKSSIKKFKNEFIGRKISLEYDGIEKTVTTDIKWLSFVIEQLISNSLKYTNDGSIKIYLINNDILCIEDTGIGIDADDLPRIFEKGYTGKIGRLEKSSSGLGLYLCKRTCDNLGIKISAKSKPNVGTKIMLDLSQYDLKKE